MLKPGYGFPPTLLLDGKVLVGDTDDPQADVPLPGAEVYAPASGTWSSAGMVSTTEEWGGLTATVLRDGRVLVAGQAGAKLYDPDSGTWTATGKMTIPRSSATATLLPDGNVLAAGGFVPPDREVNSAELYDPNSGSWTAIANMRGRHRDPTATLLRDGNVLATGRGIGVLEWEIYHAATGTWTELAEGPGFAFGTATLLLDGTVLVADLRGRVDGPEPPCPAAALYDPNTGSWTTA